MGSYLLTVGRGSALLSLCERKWNFAHGRWPLLSVFPNGIVDHYMPDHALHDLRNPQENED
eukprot:2340611-Rhodomonas_salina.3